MGTEGVCCNLAAARKNSLLVISIGRKRKQSTHGLDNIYSVTNVIRDML